MKTELKKLMLLLFCSSNEHQYWSRGNFRNHYEQNKLLILLCIVPAPKWTEQLRLPRVGTNTSSFPPSQLWIEPGQQAVTAHSLYRSHSVPVCANSSVWRLNWRSYCCCFSARSQCGVGAGTCTAVLQSAPAQKLASTLGQLCNKVTLVKFLNWQQELGFIIG